MRVETPRPVRLTATQVELLRLLASGAAVAVVRRTGPRQACRIVPNGIDHRWRRRHGGKPLQEHTVTALVKCGAVVRTVDGEWVTWRLRE